MNINVFKEKVQNTEAEARLLVGAISNPTHINSLNNFLGTIVSLIDFLNDDLSLNVLENYDNKSEEAKDNCPLDILCKNVLQKLTAAEPFLKKEIFDFLRPENNPSGARPFPRGTHSSQEFTSLSDKLKDPALKNLLSAFDILKHLEGHNKTLIVLGPNGSGKTSFANHIKNVETHIKVIPASKPIKAVGHIPGMYNATIATYNEEIYRGGSLDQDLLQKLIVGLCTEHDNAARKYYDTGVKEEETTYEKVKSIFDEFFEVKLDNSAFANKEMKAKKGGGQPFKFNDMSDGERVAFFYIATVMAAPEQSFIIVDEPENHLNPAIYNKIWNRLIDVRNDCQFIFISHTMDFINARSNFELVKIKSFVRPNKFEFEFLGTALDDIPTELIVEIVGSRKPILTDLFITRRGYFHMAIKWLFFDIGSTLVDETEAYNHRIREMLQGTAVDLADFDRMRIHFAKQGLNGDSEVINHFGLKKTPWHSEDEIPYSDAAATLKELKAHGYHIGIIANQAAGSADRLDAWGLLEYIDVVAASAELGVSKPDRAIFERAFELADCAPNEATMIGDRLDNDIIPAAELGMVTVWIPNGLSIYHDPSEFHCKPDFIIENLSELINIFE